MADALSAMGFPMSQCEAALRQASGNFDQALELLLGGGVADGAPAPVAVAASSVSVSPPPAPHPPPAATSTPASPSAAATEIPEHFLCAITCELMTNPVVTMDGHTYERSAIEEWLETHDTSPITNEELESKAVIPNIHLRTQIREFVDANPELAGGSGGGGGAPVAVPAQVPVSRRRSVAQLGAPPTTTQATAVATVSPTTASPSSSSSPSYVQPPPPPPLSRPSSFSPPSSSGPRNVTFIKGRPIGLDLDDLLCVRSVHEDSQGFTNRINRFETIVELNGESVSSVSELRQAMGRIPNQAVMEMAFSSPYVRPLTKGIPFGLSLTDAMVVQAIAPGTQAVAKGVLLNSRLVAVNDQSVTFPELAGALGAVPAGADIDFTFVPPSMIDSGRAPSQQQQRQQYPAGGQRPSMTAQPSQALARASPAGPPPPPARAPMRRVSSNRRNNNPSARLNLTAGEDHEVKLAMRQLGFAVSSVDGDEGLLRVTDVRPTAKSAGVNMGELVLALDNRPIATPCTVNEFERLCTEADRPLALRLFRCSKYGGVPGVPQQMLLSGYLQKKSSSGSKFNPWGERLVEIKANGTLTYRSEKKKKKSSSSRESFSSEGGLVDDRADDLTISLFNVSVLPLSRKRAGRDFAFEVKSSNAPSPASPGGGGPMSPGGGGGGGNLAESLTLAAASPQEGAQWIKTIQAAAAAFTESTVMRKRQQGAEVGDAMQLLTVMGDSWAAETRQREEEEALSKATADASLAEEEQRRKRREDEDDEQMRRAMQESMGSQAEEQEMADKIEAGNRARVLQGLLMSSDEYAQQLHGTADEQKGRGAHRLAYDSYKLAVSFFLKCQALADELGHDSEHVDSATMARIQNDADSTMASADECFLKSHAGEKKKKRKTEGPGSKPKDKVKDKGAGGGGGGGVSFGGETGPSASAEPAAAAATPRRSSMTASPAAAAVVSPGDDDAAWFEESGGEGAGVGGEAAGGNGLPAGWEEHLSDDGTPYYFNEGTGETTWDLPEGAAGAGAGGGAGGGMDLDAVVDGGHLSSDDSSSDSSDSSDSSEEDEEEDEEHRTARHEDRRNARRATRRATRKAGSAGGVSFGKAPGAAGGGGGEDDGGLAALRNQVGEGIGSLPEFGTSMAARATMGFSSFLEQAAGGGGGGDQGGSGGDRENEAGSSDDSDSSSGSESDYEDDGGDFDNPRRPSTASSISSADGSGNAGAPETRSRSVSLRASEGESKGRVIMELIESERRYLVILEQICHVSNWLQQETGAIKPKDHGTLFQGSTQLLDLSKGFLKDIDDQLKGETSYSADGAEEIFLEELKIGALLNKYMPFFKIYTIYSDTYDDKQARLKELVGDGSTDFAKYLRAAMEDKEVSGEFQSLLIQPIQRVPRYKMLLERMVQNIEKQEPDDDDLPLLKKSFETISGVAMHINQSLRRQVDTLKLLELQGCFFPPVVFVAPGRRLIKKGELEKIADKNNSKQKYVFFLFNDALAYGSKLFGGYYRFHRMLNVTGMDELSMTDHTTNRFRVTAEERNLTLQAKSFEDKKSWVTAIAEKMNEKHANADTFARARSASEAMSTMVMFGGKKSGGGCGGGGEDSGGGGPPAMMTMSKGFDWQKSTADRDESPERGGKTWKDRKRSTKTVNTF